MPRSHNFIDRKYSLCPLCSLPALRSPQGEAGWLKKENMFVLSGKKTV